MNHHISDLLESLAVAFHIAAQGKMATILFIMTDPDTGHATSLRFDLGPKTHISSAMYDLGQPAQATIDPRD